jgi:two-component sensor histidine kinase
LSSPQGRVRISWHDMPPEGDEAEPRMKLLWEESGGPPVKEPSRKGFGTTIIQRHAMAAFSGHVDVQFRREGLIWELIAPRSTLEREENFEDRRSLAI